MKNCIFFFKKEYVYISSVYLLISIVVTRKLLIQNGVIGYRSDWFFPQFAGQYESLLNLTIYTWDSTLSTPIILNSVYLFNLLEGLFGWIGFDGIFISKVFSLFFIFCSGLSAYDLSRKVGIKNIPSFFSGFFYMSTPVVFSQFRIGHSTELFAYAISPFLVAFFIEYCKYYPTVKKLVIIGLLFAFTWVQIHYALMNFTILLLYTIYSRNKNNYVLIYFISVNIIAIIVHIPWILTLLMSYSTETSSNINVLSTSKYLLHMSPSFVDAIRLKGYVPIPDTFDQIVLTGQIPFKIYEISSYVIPLLIFFAILLKPKNYYFNFFMFITVFSFVFSTGVNRPFGGVFYWLYYNVSLTVLFREVYHLMYIPAISYSILLGISIEHICHQINKQQLKLIFYTFLVIIIFIAHWPIFTGDFAGVVQTYNLSDETKEVYDFIKSEDGYFKVGWVPMMSSLYSMDSKFFDTARDPMIVLSPKPTLDADSTITWNRHYAFISRVLENNKSKYFGELIGFTGVKYIINRNTVRSRYSQTWGQSKILNEQKDLELYKKYEDISIYKNKYMKPIIYPIDTPVILYGDLSTIISFQNYVRSKGIEMPTFLLNPKIPPSDKKFNTVVYGENGFYESIFLNISSEYKYYPQFYIKEWYPTFGWSNINSNWGINWYQIIFPHSGVITLKSSILEIPLETTENESYSIFAEIYYGPEASDIEFKTDGFYKKIDSKINEKEYIKWTYIGDLNGKNNTILSVNAGDGINILGEIVVIKNKELHDYINIYKDSIFNKTIYIINEDKNENNIQFLNILQNKNNHIILINKYIGENISSVELNKSMPNSNMELTYHQVNPTKTMINVNNFSKPFTIVFLEQYNEQWKAYITSSNRRINWIEALYKQPIPQNDHYVINGYANAWYIDPQKFDTAENFTITLYFKPQSYLNIGFIILSIMLSVFVGYLLWDLKRKVLVY